jgi:hypothetical protein
MNEMNRDRAKLNLWKALFLRDCSTLHSPLSKSLRKLPETKKIVIYVSVPGVMGSGGCGGLPGPELGPEPEEVRLVLVVGVLGLPQGGGGVVGPLVGGGDPHLPPATQLPLGRAAVDHRALDTVTHPFDNKCKNNSDVFTFQFGCVWGGGGTETGLQRA